MEKEQRLNDNMCNFKIGAYYKNTEYDPNSDTLRSVKYFIYLGENTFSPIYDWGYEIRVKLEYDTWKNFVEVTKDEAFRNVNGVNMNDNEVTLRFFFRFLRTRRKIFGIIPHQ